MVTVNTSRPSAAHNLGFRYDTIIFDVGGTLTGFHDREPFQEFLASTGLPASDVDAHCLHRRLISVILSERDNAQGLGADGTELDNWWRGIFAKTWPDRPDLVEEMLHWLLNGRFDRAFDDALPTLETLKAKGMPMGVVSNFGSHLERVLRLVRLRDFFDFVIVSAEVGLAKPDPRIFDLAVSRAGQHGQRLLYVGDHFGDDIEGAWSAGIDAVLIDRKDRQPEALCPRIESLLDLASYIQPPTRPAPAIILDMDGVVLDLQMFEPTLVPGTAPLLYDLQGRGYRLGLVARSVRSVVDQSLATTGLAKLFEVIVAGDGTAQGKPYPELYQTAAASLGLPPAQCLAVVSAPLSIQSAKTAGMGCVALETTLSAERLYAATADRVFPQVKALRAWLLSC